MSVNLFDACSTPAQIHRRQFSTEDFSRLADWQSETEHDVLCMDLTADGRFAKIGGPAVKTQYGEISNGFDRDTGNEVMWRVINANRVDQSTFTKWMLELQKTIKLDCKYMLKYYCCERRSEREIILITETISRGTLSTYLDTFKHPRISVCQAWFRQILEGLQYLHSHHLTHGFLTCDHIFINSNTGELKIGDLCLVKLMAIMDDRPTFNRPVDDIHRFGLVVLEVVFAQVLSAKTLCKVMQRLYDSPTLDKTKVIKLLRHVGDEEYRSLIEACLYADGDVSIKDLLQHKFFTTVRGKDETLRGIKHIARHRHSAYKARLTKSSKGVKLKVTENSLQADSPIRSHVINVSIKIAGMDRTSNIQFQYDMNNDTPEGVAQEMRATLSLPEDYIVAIQSQIRCAIQDYINELAKTVGHIRNPSIECKVETVPPGGANREFSADPETKQFYDFQPRLNMTKIRQPSMSGSISPIDTCSAASVGTSITVMENLRYLKAMCAKTTVHNGNVPREEPLQPEATYSDIQLTPRNNDFEDEVGGRGVAREVVWKGNAGIGKREKEEVSLEKKPAECGGEGEESEGQAAAAKGAPSMIQLM